MIKSSKADAVIGGLVGVKSGTDIFLLMILYLATDLIVTIIKHKTFVPVKALCVHISEAYFHTEDSSSYGRKGTFTYSYNGNTYIESEKTFISTRRLRPGKSVKIMVNPKNPQSFMTIENIKTSYLIDVLGIALLSVAVALW